MKNILILTIALLLLNGCGGSDSESSGSTDTAGIVPDRGDTLMVLNQPYVVSKGDQIFKDSDLAKVKVTHTDGSTKSTVELIEGSATLRRN